MCNLLIHWRQSNRTVPTSVWFLGLVLLPLAVWAEPDPIEPRPTLVIPRVDHPPQLEDFLEMKPNGRMDGKLAKVEGFLQFQPSDGKPASQRTEAYLGYDDKNLYVVFICFDNEPGRLRARMVPREQFVENLVSVDDSVSITIDTFADQRRGYVFQASALGIQWDALNTEGQGFDTSFDALWHSNGQVTPQGFVVWMAIPFKSLRFPATPRQRWGILINRDIPRNNEITFWPYVTMRIEGFLNQAAPLEGLENISPGRNIQLIPYAAARSFRALDLRDPNRPRFVRDRFEPDAGLDAKIVFQDSLVLDVALNPDFSQVESDEPQVTVNQRFEVFFPEKRPFFLENASYFQTPINLLFTRRIGDPQFGLRLTGKRGPYAIGALFADDQGPGRSLPPNHPLAGRRAYFTILRLNRDLFKQSTLGAIYADREFEGSHNRIGGVDARLKLAANWTARAQAVTSATQDLAGNRLVGPAYWAEVSRVGRQWIYQGEYEDRGRGFFTEPGFQLRPDIRRVSQGTRYLFRPERTYLISWGPQFFYQRIWDHSGRRLDWTYDNNLVWELTGQTEFAWAYNNTRERLRQQDFPVLAADRDFNRKHWAFRFRTSYIRQVSVEGFYFQGDRINFFPPAGQEPVLANWNEGRFRLTVRPLTRLRVDNTYLLTRLRDRPSGATILNNHVLRSKWNWQFTRALSLRVIFQYTSTLASPALTLLPTSKRFNADFLITYLVHPGTALYIGYNGNLENIFLCEGPGMGTPDCPSLPANRARLIRRPNRYLNDAGQFFVKFSYLFRF